MPTELGTQEVYGISRQTARRAMQDLVAELIAAVPSALLDTQFHLGSASWQALLRVEGLYGVRTAEPSSWPLVASSPSSTPTASRCAASRPNCPLLGQRYSS